MRIIGMDIHRAFAEVAALEAGKLSRLGRVDMRRALLQAFAEQLRKNDELVIEATGNAAAVAEVIGPHVKRVVIANPKQVRIIAQKLHDIAPGSTLHDQRIVPVGGMLRQNGRAKLLLQPGAGNRCITHESLHSSVRLIPLQGATLPGIEEANRQDHQEDQHGHQSG